MVGVLGAVGDGASVRSIGEVSRRRLVGSEREGRGVVGVGAVRLYWEGVGGGGGWWRLCWRGRDGGEGGKMVV